MRVRRYYKKGVKYPYTISEEYFEKLIKDKGMEEAMRIDNAEKEIKFDSIEEEKQWFRECLHRVISEPRYYLDNLDKLMEFQVRKTTIFGLKKDEKRKPL